MNHLIGKNAIVTGANSGMGMATARALLDEGATVVMLCRSEKRGKEAFRIQRTACAEAGRCNKRLKSTVIKGVYPKRERAL